jgi:uncharacterized membrane protein
MKNKTPLLAVLGLVLLISGCAKGLIYSHTVRPLDINHHQTPVIQKSKQGNIKHIQYYVSVTWDSNAIGDIATENGLETVYYADLEVLSVLGVWRQFIVHVYGK